MNEDVKWLFGLIIVFGIVWFVTGGLNKTTSKEPFIKPLLNTDQVEVYGNNSVVRTTTNNSPGISAVGPSIGSSNQRVANSERSQIAIDNIKASLERSGIQTETIKIELALLAEKNSASPLSGKISIGSVTYGRTSSDGELVILRASSANNEKVLLTGLRLESVISGRGATIAKGVQLPFQNQINTEQPIYLSPGETVYILTGRSPLGMSFRLNKCTGFFSQFQSFNPSIPSRCPNPSSESLPPPANQYNDQCLNYINSLSGCRVIITPPLDISPECQRYVTTEINYSKCVDRHKNDSDFYDPEWRVYLGRDDALWKNQREIIHLLDKNGKIVDVATY